MTQEPNPPGVGISDMLHSGWPFACDECKLGWEAEADWHEHIAAVHGMRSKVRPPRFTIERYEAAAQRPQPYPIVEVDGVRHIAVSLHLAMEASMNRTFNHQVNALRHEVTRLTGKLEKSDKFRAKAQDYIRARRSDLESAAADEPTLTVREFVDRDHAAARAHWRSPRHG